MSVNSLKRIIEIEGFLYPIEFSDIESTYFPVKRMFYVTNVPAGEERGKHAHYLTKQILICIQGKLEVRLFDGFNKTSNILTPGQYIFVDRLIWDSQIYLGGFDIMLSLCSTSYDKEDYINDINEFIKLKEQIKYYGAPSNLSM